MAIQKNNQYPLFAEYYKTYAWILHTMEGMPRSIKFTLADRVIVVATEALENIIEAIYAKEKKTLLHGVNLRLEKLRIFFRILFDGRHISEKQYAHISENIDVNGKMTGGWLKTCNG